MLTIDDESRLQLVNSGKYIDRCHGERDKASGGSKYTFAVHPTVCAVSISYVVENQSNSTSTTYYYGEGENGNEDVVKDATAHSEHTAWLFEEVRTSETTLNEQAEGFGTFCMDFPAILPTEGVRVRYPATPTDDDGDGLYTMKWTTITGSMPATTAVLLEGTAGATYKFYETERATTADISGNAMASTRETGYVYFVLSKPAGYPIGFYKFTGTLHSDRGYIRMETASAAKVRGFVFDDDMVTGIEEVDDQVAEDAQVYDLIGRRVMKPAKGIYVINGKKTIISK